MELSGQIVRIVPTMGLVYLADSSTGRVYSFRLDVLEDYTGESLNKCGIHIGASVAFRASHEGQVHSAARPGKLLKKAGLAAAGSE